VHALDARCKYYQGKLASVWELEEASNTTKGKGGRRDVHKKILSSSEVSKDESCKQAQLDGDGDGIVLQPASETDTDKRVCSLNILEEKVIFISQADEYCQQLNDAHYELCVAETPAPGPECQKRQNPPFSYHCAGYMYQADKKNPVDARFRKPIKVLVTFFAAGGRSCNELVSKKHGFGILPTSDWHTYLVEDAHSVLESFSQTMEQQYSEKDDER
jgi:hypothetical protein